MLGVYKYFIVTTWNGLNDDTFIVFLPDHMVRVLCLLVSKHNLYVTSDELALNLDMHVEW